MLDLVTVSPLFEYNWLQHQLEHVYFSYFDSNRSPEEIGCLFDMSTLPQSRVHIFCDILLMWHDNTLMS